MREKIIIEPGQKVRVTLDRVDAKPVESRTGKPEFMRVVDNDERILFAPVELEQAIKDSGATAGDIVQISRHARSGRNAWDVAIVYEDKRKYSGGPYVNEPPRRPLAGEAALGVGPEDLPPANRPAPQREITSEAADMTSAFIAAIEAAGAAEQYAERAGLRDFRLNTEAVKNLAVTIYIQRRGKN